MVKKFPYWEFFLWIYRKYLTGHKKKADGGGKYVHIFIWWIRIARRYVHILCLFFIYDFPLLSLSLGGRHIAFNYLLI